MVERITGRFAILKVFEIIDVGVVIVCHVENSPIVRRDNELLFGVQYTKSRRLGKKEGQV